MKNYLSTLFVAVGIALSATTATGKPVVQINQSLSHPAIDAKEIISDIISTVGLKQNFNIMESQAVPNAAAVIYKGQRFIAYNPRFVADLNTVAGNKWAAVSILAHEIGHHLNGHTLLNTGSQPSLELEADEFSGFVLRKMGASLAQAQAAMKIAAGYQQSSTHPAQPDRLVAIARGWNQAAKVPADLAKYSEPEANMDKASVAAATKNLQAAMLGKQPTVRTASHTPNASLINNSNIIASIDFPSDRTSAYFVTRGYNLVKVVNNEMYLLGKMLPTTSNEFPFVLRNRASSDLFVHQSGKILTARKQLAGYIKMKG